MVVNVEPDSPADRGGLLIGDILLALDDRAVSDPGDVLAALGGDRIGQPIALRVARGGRAETAVGDGGRAAPCPALSRSLRGAPGVEAALGEVAERLRRVTVHVHAGGRSAGAGVVWLRSGLVVTNAHVAAGPARRGRAARRPRAPGPAGRARSAARPRRARRDAGDLRRPALRADARGLRPGELVVALGHPLGVAYAAALGVVHRAPSGDARSRRLAARRHPARPRQLRRPAGGRGGTGSGDQRDDRGRARDRGARRTWSSCSSTRSTAGGGGRRARGVIRVLVVARSELERAGLEALLASRGHVAVGGGSATLAEARRRVEEDSAAGGARAARPRRRAVRGWRSRRTPSARTPALVVLGEALPRGWAVRAVRAGVRAVLPRTASADAIVAAVEAAAAGLVVLPADALVECRRPPPRERSHRRRRSRRVRPRFWRCWRRGW